MTLSALLLAGGRSHRMGIDKATVAITGRPLWQRQLGVLNELQPRAVWVSARTMPAWCPPGIEMVADPIPSCGPLSGLAAGLRRVQTSHLLVLAIDLPLMTGEHLRKLSGTARPGLGVVPQHGGCFEPLCAVYSAEASAAADEALRRGEASLQNFVRDLLGHFRVRAYDLTPGEGALYLNMNTPTDIPGVGRPSSGT
jgi:molybdopterin-guanine dinucleotide biosynthesis protein A